MAHADIRVGTASWSDHEPFYPPEYDRASMKARRIEYYARYFSMVEVDATFYHLLPQRSFAQWADRTPPGFVFDVKAYGELTWHHRDDQGAAIAPSADSFARFSAMVQPLRDAGKLGALLFQFPPWFTFDEDRLDYLATLRELLPADTIAVEFRQRSWLEGERLDVTRAALAANRLAYCAVDEPQIGSGSVPPVFLVTDPTFAMVRFHGRNRRLWYGRNRASSRDRFDYLYTRQELQPWAARIADVASQLEGGAVHVVTNNNATTTLHPSIGQDMAGDLPQRPDGQGQPALPAVAWPKIPQPEAILNALMLQHLLGQPVGQGNPLPDTIDGDYLRAELGPDAAPQTPQTPQTPPALPAQQPPDYPAR